MSKRCAILLLSALAFVAATRAADLVAVTNALAPQAANLITRCSPREIKVHELGLCEAGLAASPYFAKADEIRIFSSDGKMNESPLARLWINSRERNRYWFQTGGQGSAEDYVVPKGAAVVVMTTASTNAIAWQNHLAETAP